MIESAVITSLVYTSLVYPCLAIRKGSLTLHTSTLLGMQFYVMYSNGIICINTDHNSFFPRVCTTSVYHSDSKAIEIAGGYQFNITSVPNAFVFKSP